MAYQKKKTGSKQEIAYQSIKRAILNNEYEPDAMLIEGVLCEQLGFSKTPVREALRRLASENYVQYIPEKGTFVSKMEMDDFIQIFDVREALEGMAAKICALRKDKALVDKLEITFNQIYIDLIDGNSVLNIKDDLEFHHLIIEGSRNKNLINFSRSLMDQINRYASTTYNDPDRLKLSFNEHREILDAITSGDPELSEKKLREHIRSVKEYQIKRHYLSF
ncbi:MAG: GntR family transcriptional regulator [Eubacteriales bacterium]|nr:GntR family transcriptional regulator [Eubacteriales bacterium]